MFDVTRSSKLTIENQLEKYKEISCDSAVTCYALREHVYEIS